MGCPLRNDILCCYRGLKRRLRRIWVAHGQEGWVAGLIFLPELTALNFVPTGKREVTYLVPQSIRCVLQNVDAIFTMTPDTVNRFADSAVRAYVLLVDKARLASPVG